MEKYRVGIYMRLSREDDRTEEESNSITMQRLLLKRYVTENFTDYELHEFCDDGYTGTNLERPGMRGMLEMAKDGGIDCIIVKDFSRFARDYIELGSYLEQIFPFLGIRFISVNDHYDSMDGQGSISDLDVNFKNLLYDLYSKDLSVKVRSALAVRKEKGLYVSANSPFGYEKDPKDRHALLVAEDEAEVVRRIFSLTLGGYTSVGIARLFNETGVKTPVEFKMEKGKMKRVPKGERFVWNSSTICQILRNEIYIGNIVQKKSARDYGGGKNRLNPREDWLVSCNHHEAIIDKEVFARVQEGRGKKRPPQQNPTHPLTGKLVCGCCKKNLQYREGLNPYFSCRQRYSNAMKNCVHKVNAMFMEQYVLFMVQDRLEMAGGNEELPMETAHRSGHDMVEWERKRQLLIAEIEKRKKENFESYQKYACGKTGSFQSNERMVKAMEKELEELDGKIQEMGRPYSRGQRYGDRMDLQEQPVTLSKEMLDRYIDKIIVCDEENMEIIWKETGKVIGWICSYGT